LSGLTKESTILFNAEDHRSYSIRAVLMIRRVLKLTAVHFHFFRVDVVLLLRPLPSSSNLVRCRGLFSLAFKTLMSNSTVFRRSSRPDKYSFPTMTFEEDAGFTYMHSNPNSSQPEHFGLTPSHLKISHQHLYYSIAPVSRLVGPRCTEVSRDLHVIFLFDIYCMPAIFSVSYPWSFRVPRYNRRLCSLC
jgi:hypothetical protein